MKKLLMILLLLPLFSLSAYAEMPEGKSEEIFQTERLTEGLREEELLVGGEPRMDGRYDTRGALGRLWERFYETAANTLRESMEQLVGLSALLLFTGLASAASGVFSGSGLVLGFVIGAAAYWYFRNRNTRNAAESEEE